jgi:hypothetical protein
MRCAQPPSPNTARGSSRHAFAGMGISTIEPIFQRKASPNLHWQITAEDGCVELFNCVVALSNADETDDNAIRRVSVLNCANSGRSWTDSLWIQARGRPGGRREGEIGMRRFRSGSYLRMLSSAAERAFAALNAYFFSAIASARPSRRSSIACAASHFGRSLR